MLLKRRTWLISKMVKHVYEDVLQHDAVRNHRSLGTSGSKRKTSAASGMWETQKGQPSSCSGSSWMGLGDRRPRRLLALPHGDLFALALRLPRLLLIAGAQLKMRPLSGEDILRTRES